MGQNGRGGGRKLQRGQDKWRQGSGEGEVERRWEKRERVYTVHMAEGEEAEVLMWKGGTREVRDDMEEERRYRAA